MDCSTLNKWQKTSHYLWERGAAAPSTATTNFETQRRYPLGMQTGSGAIQDVYKQPGGMNPHEESGFAEQQGNNPPHPHDSD